jgi:hypothetical protein
MVLILQRACFQQLVHSQITKLLHPWRIDGVHVTPQLQVALAGVEVQHVIAVRMLRIERIQERHAIAIQERPQRRGLRANAVLHSLTLGIEQECTESS